MDNQKLTFIRKKPLAYSMQNLHEKVIYDISHENGDKSTLTILSTINAVLETGQQTFHIRPILKFWTEAFFDVLLDTSEIGKIEYWGWAQRKPKLIFQNNGDPEVWIFERNEPGFFQSRPNPFTTKLQCGTREVVYNLEFEKSSITIHSSKSLTGTASFEEADRMPCLLGIYFNELIIFEEMGK